MHKMYGNIAMLPDDVRSSINRKIRDGWKYRTIVSWLFTQIAQQDIPDLDIKTGEHYSLIWTRNTKHKMKANARCLAQLASWFKNHYSVWLDEEATKEQSIRLVEHLEKLTSASGDKRRPGSSAGGTILIRSLLLDAINKVRKKDNNPEDLARLANAWSRVNESGHRVQGHIDLGLQSLRDEIKTNPEALDAFNKLHGVVKKSGKRSS